MFRRAKFTLSDSSDRCSLALERCIALVAVFFRMGRLLNCISLAFAGCFILVKHDLTRYGKGA